MKIIDETGNIYGKLTVIIRAPNLTSSKRNRIKWECVCECGNKKIVSGEVLRRGSSKSCGCTSYVAQTLPAGEAAFNNLYSSYSGRARKVNRDWFIDKDQFRDLLRGKCFYCGCEPSQVNNISSSNGVFRYNGIDRVDNKKGYVLGNVVPCCGICNIAKHALGYQEFLIHVQKIYNYRVAREFGCKT